jgi:GGDEF domain-containing protein
MGEIGPWLVVGGASLVVVCVGITLLVVLRVLRRNGSAVGDRWAARSALAAAADATAADDDELMPLLLAAAIEATRADAAVVTFVRSGNRRRSYSAHLDLREARAAIDVLVALRAPEAGLAVPIAVPEVKGVLAVYWRGEASRAVDVAELDELAASAFQPLHRPADTGVRQLPSPDPTEDDERERWSRVADLNQTIETPALLRKIVAATITHCGADAAAAGTRALDEQEPVAEALQFEDHEQPWAESVLSSETAIPSITRYVARGEPPAGAEPPIGTAIVVPLRDPQGEAIGNLVAAWRRDLADEADEKVSELELLVDDARAALGNAGRFRRLQSIAGRDPLAGLFDQRYFLGLLAGAVEAARRSSQPLTLALLTASEIEPEAHDVRVTSLEEALANASARIADELGGRGTTCRVGLGDFVVIMPDTDLAAARRLLDAITEELSAEATGETTLKWSASPLELGDSERADELWERARRQLRPAEDARPASGPTATPALGRTMRLSLGGRREDWTLEKKAPDAARRPESGA